MIRKCETSCHKPMAAIAAASTTRMPGPRVGKGIVAGV